MPGKKVYLLQEIIPSYRVPVFRRISQLEDVDLTVFYSRQSRAMRRENLRSTDHIEGFRHIQTVLLDVGRRSYQFGMLWHVLTGRPDVVVAGQAGRLDRLLLLFICKLTGVRMLWYMGGVPYIHEEEIRRYRNRGRLNRWLGRLNPMRWMTLRADGLIAYSEHARNYYIDEGFTAARVWVAPNSPDTCALLRYRDEWLARPHELESERQRFCAQGNKVIFLLGRLNRDRKADVLLKALSRLASRGARVSLVIVGDGSEREALQRQADSLELNGVFFEGAVYDEKELCKYFLVSDIFVTPGVASMALKMAMTLGKPVVTVNYGLEVHDIDDGVNGFVFPMGDDEILADKIMSLLESDELIERIGSAGEATIRDRVNIHMLVESFRKAVFGEQDTITAGVIGAEGHKGGEAR